MAALFFLVTFCNALQMELGTTASLEMSLKAMSFESYEGSKHPVKPVALVTALQNVKKLPNEIRAMLVKANETAAPEVVLSAHDRARAVKEQQNKFARQNAFLTASTTHGAHLLVDANSGMDPNAEAPDDGKYATLDKVRQTLNDLYQQTMQEMDVERADCFDAELTLKTEIQGNTETRVELAGTIAQARGEIAQAHMYIEQSTDQIETTGRELVTHNMECKHTLDMAYEKRHIIESDLGVAQTVENMTDCDKMEANAASMGTAMLFQCMVSFAGKSHFTVHGPAGELMKKFKSKEALMAMMTAARSSLGVDLDTDPAGKAPELPAGNMSQEEYNDWKNLPTDTDWMNEVKVTELPKSCKALNGKINLGEKCGILYDAVGQMVGEISDALHYQNVFIDQEEFRCKETREEKEQSIKYWNGVLSANQIAFAEATEKLTTNQNALEMAVKEFIEFRDALIHRMGTCNDNLRQLFEEMCGLITIRNELYKMSGVQVYMQDCQVSDWSPEECTVSCGGGTQVFGREITQEQYFGAACPPLSKTTTCNGDPCPVDCVYEADWSQWSACSADCGGGLAQRTRSIGTRDANGGEQCEATQDSKACNSGACSEDCVLGEWGDWTSCNKECDGGIQTRLKPVLEGKAAFGPDGKCADQFEEMVTADGGGARFEQKACNPEACLPDLACDAKMDLALVLDGSGSIGRAGWDATMRLAKNMLDRMYFNEDDGGMMGVVQFSSNVRIVSQLSGDKEHLSTQVSAMTWTGGYTLTGEAIKVAQSLLSTGGRAGVPGTIFVVTDGDPTFKIPTENAAIEAKRQGVRLFFAGVGTKIKYEALNRWATAPHTQNVKFIESFDALDNDFMQLLADMCPTLECSEHYSLSDESDYKGCQTETVAQITCQKWTDTTPHEFYYTPSVTNGDGTQRYPKLGNHNFCRNPDLDSGGIWCYTMDEADRWDYCNPRNSSSIPMQQVF